MIQQIATRNILLFTYFTIMIKKLTLNLKEPQLEVINNLKKMFLIASDKEMVNKCIKSALNLNKNDLIFSPIKEKCRGGCFASEPQFEIGINVDIFIQLQKIYAENEFENYKTNEEEVSKVIRCIINFFKDEADLIII